MGRHAVKKKLTAGRLALLSIVIIVIAGLAAGLFWPGAPWNGLIAQAISSCTQPKAIVVVADSSIHPVVDGIAGEFAAREDVCATIEVRSQDSSETAGTLASRTAVDADVWIPDSPVWLDRMTATARSLGRATPHAHIGWYLASTPVVLATTASALVEMDVDITWAQLLAGGTPPVLPDPRTSAASLAALQALDESRTDGDDREFASSLIALGNAGAPTIAAAIDSVLNSETSTLVLTSESAIAAHNAADPEQPLTAIYPSDGTVYISYPFVRLTVPGGGVDLDTEPERMPRDKAGLVDEFERALMKAGSVFASSGFRPGDMQGDLQVQGLNEKVAETRPSARLQQLDLLRSWGIVGLRSRLLTVVDVSGSMLDPTEDGRRRIDVFQEAAVGALERMPADTQMGMWAFSSARVGDQDWEELAPIGSLSSSEHSASIRGIIDSLPQRIGGGTGLYDTTLAATEQLRAQYEADRVNAVLLITDGRNEDDWGLDLDTLLAELERTADPDRPVPVIMIGFGPDTDLPAMTRIAEATGGAAYVSTAPEDLRLVLIDALSGWDR